MRNRMRSPNGGLTLRVAATVSRAPFAIIIVHHTSRGSPHFPGFTTLPGVHHTSRGSPALLGPPHSLGLSWRDVSTFILFRPVGPVCPVANSPLSAFPCDRGRAAGRDERWRQARVPGVRPGLRQKEAGARPLSTLMAADIGYSTRSARHGSTSDARRAGRNAATRAIATSSTQAATHRRRWRGRSH